MSSPLQGLRLVLYVRVSSAKQVDGYSIDAQIREAKIWATKHGVVIIASFVEAKSASSEEGRPEFERAIHHVIKNQRADGLLVHESSRFGRNEVFDHSAMHRLEQAEKRVYSVTEPFFGGPAQSEKLTTAITIAVNADKARRIGSQSRKGRREKANQGRYPHTSVTYGLRWRDDKSNIEADPDYASLIQMAFQIYETGKYNLTTWTEKAYKLGILSKSGRKIPASTWHKYFTNKVYIGYFEYEGVEYEGTFERLIYRETFDKVNAILERAKVDSQKPSGYYILSQMLWSEETDKPITCSTNKGYRYYKAGRKNHPCADIEERVAAYLNNITGHSPLCPPAMSLALRLADRTGSLRDLFLLLDTPQEQREFLQVIFKKHGIVLAAGGAVVDCKLNDGFVLNKNLG